MATSPSVSAGVKGPDEPLFRAQHDAISYRRTELHDAAATGLYWTVFHLINSGADPNERDSEGSTPLVHAATHGHDQVVRLLLSRGAKLNAHTSKRSILFGAVEGGHVAVVRVLLQAEAPVTGSVLRNAAHKGWKEILCLLAAQIEGTENNEALMTTALNYAIHGNHEDIVRMILEGKFKWKCKWNLAEMYFERAFLIALRKGNSHSAIIKLLLKEDVNINACFEEMQTPLGIMANRCDVEVAKLLIDAGAKVEYEDRSGNRPIHKALDAKEKLGDISPQIPILGEPNVAIVRFLLDHGASTNPTDTKGNTPLMKLARSPCLTPSIESIMQILLDGGADIALTGQRVERTALDWAILMGHQPLVHLLLAREEATSAKKDMLVLLTKLYHMIRAKNNDGIQVLLRDASLQQVQQVQHLLQIYIPAEHGSEAVVRLFLDLGADIEAKSEHGRNALSLAAGNGNIDIVKLLINSGADVNSRDSSAHTVLDRAALIGWQERAKVFKKQDASAEANALASAADRRREEMFTVLLQSGVSIEGKNKGLYHAVIGGDVSALRLLLANGAEVDTMDHMEATALCVAALHNNEEVIKILLEAGANVNAKSLSFGGTTPLGRAVLAGHKTNVRLLLEYGANVRVRRPGACEGTLLHVIVSNNSDGGTAKLLLDGGLDIEARDGRGYTALALAVGLGNVAKARLLLELGANPAAVPWPMGRVGGYPNKENVELALMLLRDAQQKRVSSQAPCWMLRRLCF